MTRLRTALSALTAVAAAASVALVAPTASTASTTASAGSTAERLATSYPLPDGFQPEGIAVRGRPYAFLGSLADGDIYRINLRTGAGRIVSEGPGTPSNGLKLDQYRRLWVAGGRGGDARLVNPRAGRTVRTYRLGGTFINDVVEFRGRAWFTDSSEPVLRSVEIRRPGQQRPGFQSLPLRGAWTQVPDEINANGIAVTPDGRALLVVQSATGFLFRVNPETGRAIRVRLGGALLTNGDGLLTQGRTLYVVQNRLNRIAVVRLARSGRAGALVRTITSAGFDVPTTVALRKGSLFLPNARFGTEPTPTTTYDVVRVRR